MKRVIVIMSVLWVSSAKAQTLPTGFNQVLVTNGINMPTQMAFAPDGRIFVAQQTGELRIIKNGTLLVKPFMSLNVYFSVDRGLFGIAFDPNFVSNHYIYLYYSLASGTNNRISRFTANGDVVVAGSEVPILDLDPIGNSLLHFGGDMKFGPDGKLYVSTGDNFYPANAQNLDTYHGKILRINNDGSVPAGNPYTAGSKQKLRVWASGLRNAYTLTFQPGTGRLFVNDVGNLLWEEINEATARGKNFGWPGAEGNSSSTTHTNPVYNYAHGTGSGRGCAITGGTFFNPSSTNYPSSYIGNYFYIDYCGKWIDMIRISGDTVIRSNFANGLGGSPVIIQTGTDGNLYYLSRDNKALYKITYTSTFSPVITQHPQSISVSKQKPAIFSVIASGILPLTYQWRKNGTNIPGATSASYTIVSVTDASAGDYSVVITNSYGTATSNNAALTVTPFNYDPEAKITLPVAGATYAAGHVITFSGSGKDTEDGPLNAGSFEWYVMFCHGTHKHPGPSAPSGVAGGSFTIPNIGETSPNVFYRLYLVVTDSRGAKDTAYTDILPRTSTITLNTDPQGLKLTLDGQPFTSPFTVTSVEGMRRTLGVISPQTVNNVYTFYYNNWLQGGAQTQTITTPVNNVNYKANFYYLKVNFQDSATTPPAGWLRDFGQSFGNRTSSYQGEWNMFGWKRRSDTIPVDLTLNGRKRTTPSDILLGTLMHMQANNVPGTSLTPVEGIWEVKVPNGKYAVTSSVGDGAYFNSKHSINVEGINAINGFVPTPGAMFNSATVTAIVNDGFLTIDATGGFNTKINTVIIQPSVSVITLPPLADAYIQGPVTGADSNYGNNTALRVRFSGGKANLKSYLKFPLNNLTNIISANLRLYGRNWVNTTGIKVSAFGVDNDAWTEYGITWNNAPVALTTSSGVAYVDDTLTYHDIEVTNFVKTQLAGDKVVSLLIKQDSNINIKFNSKESGLYFPQLVLITETPDAITAARRQSSEITRDDVISAVSLNLSPNPATNILQIFTGGLQQNKKLTISVVSVSGVVLKTIHSTSKQIMQIDVSSLTPGVYFLKVLSGDKVMNTRFVKL